MYQTGELFRRMLDERTAGLPSVGLLNVDTESLGSDITLDERYRDPNDEILVRTATRELSATSKFRLVILQFIIDRNTIPRICFCCKLVCVLTVL